MAVILTISLVISSIFVVKSSAYNEQYECIGEECPTFSLPQTFEDSNISCNCTEPYAFKDPKDCHQYYFCFGEDENATATKFKCPEGYGYHEEWQTCVPENMIKNCSAIFCPPYIYDGVIPDPKNCRVYYRCNYGFPRRQKCPRRTVFEAETGLCRRYEKEPDCLKKPDPVGTTTTTTTAAATTLETTTSTTLPPDTSAPVFNSSSTVSPTVSQNGTTMESPLN